MQNLPSKDPASICAALRALGTQSATMERIAEVEPCLDSKYSSVQSVAAQVLAGWRSHNSLPKLKAAFERLSGTNTAQHRILANAMGEVLQPSDTQAMIDWFLSLPSYNARFALLPTVARVDANLAKPLLEKAWATADRELKHSIMVAASEMRDPRMFIPRALKDSDSYIRDLARMFI